MPAKNKIKLQLVAFEYIVLGEMLKSIIVSDLPETLYLEKLIIAELYERKIAVFTLANSSKLSLSYAESVALNRLLNNLNFGKITGGERVRYAIINTIEPKLLKQ